VCGRYTLTRSDEELVEIFGVEAPGLEWSPRFNIAPTQYAPVIASDARGTRVGTLRWGLVPSWSKDEKIAGKLINARGETLLEKPSFREAARRRRCLVVTDGFYEWTGEKGAKTPHWIHMPGAAPFTFAGLWESWNGPEETLHTFTIVTVDANEQIRHLHDRMPAVIAPDERERWLQADEPETALELLRPYEGAVEHHAVSTLVNNVRNDEPELLEAVG